MANKAAIEFQRHLEAKANKLDEIKEKAETGLKQKYGDIMAS